MIKAVLFDLDGTLFDTEKYQDISFLEDLKKIGITDFAFNKIQGTMGMAIQDFERLMDEWLLKNHNISYQEFEKQSGHKQENGIPFSDIVTKNALELLNYLKDHGYRLAICSSSNMSYIQKAVKDGKMENIFDIIISGREFKNPKPNPDIYLHAAKELKVKPEECIVVEDSTTGIKAGKSANCFTIAYHNPYYKIDQSFADVVVDDILDVIKYL